MLVGELEGGLRSVVFNFGAIIRRGNSCSLRRFLCRHPPYFHGSAARHNYGKQGIVCQDMGEHKQINEM